MPRRLQPDHEPTPFTADEIRQGCPVGREVVTLTSAIGGTPQLRTSLFARHRAGGADVEYTTRTIDGRVESGPEIQHSTWLQFQAHASFPSAETAVEEVILESVLGTLECLCYTVGSDDGFNRFWFARSLPGMPVLVHRLEHGKLSSVMQMVSSRQ